MLQTGELSKAELAGDDAAVVVPSLLQLRQAASNTPVGLRGADETEEALPRLAVLGATGIRSMA